MAGPLIPLTPAAQIMRLQTRPLSASRIALEHRIADGVRARECREVLAHEWPRMRSCQVPGDPCIDTDSICENCDRWIDTQMLNARINCRAERDAA